MYVYNDTNNSRVHTPIMSTGTHYFGKVEKKKKRFQDVSLKETFKGTNTTFLFFYLFFLLNFLFINADLAQSN
jgi:hypothetical protein